MLTVIGFCQNDSALARSLLKWIVELGRCKNHKALLVCDSGMQWSAALEIHQLANEAFASADLITTDEHYEGWPEAANWMWYTAAEHIAKYLKEPFLWLEPDCVPLKPGWLNKLSGEYQGGYLGHIYKYEIPNSPFAPIDVMSGIAVYPVNAFAQIGGIIKARPKEAWDVGAAGLMTGPKNGWHTNLIHHFFGQKNLPPTFVNAKVNGSPVNAMTLSSLPKDAVLFHRNKDGTLIAQLRNKMARGGFRASPTLMADFVSLRRAGDIIILLPALRALAHKWKRPVQLAIHKDFVDLLEGTSYVRPSLWSGDWEAPLEAAKHFNAVNAQVFGKGLNPNVKDENFAKLAWKKLGLQWNRYLPLVFDWRDFDREAKLAASVIKGGKPLLLLKTFGHSSPFPDRQWLMEQVSAEFGNEAEILNLDEVKAERLYDLIGLMDRANCLITIDTAPLWLSHASKVPVIQFVNGYGFAGSPPRGNCLARVPYSSVRPQWSRLVPIIRSTFTKTAGNGIVLAYSDWRPTNPDTARRNSAAMNTWGTLKARFFPHRTQKQFNGNPNGPPFVREMIISAFNSGQENIVVITNNDIKMDPKLRDAVLKSCEESGCFWCYRTPAPGGPTDQGADLFAMTRDWWSVHQHLIPDFLMGHYWWDDMLVRIMQWSGCQEQPRLYYHEPHKSDIVRDPVHNPGEKHNEALATAWIKTHDERRQKPADP